MHQFNWQSALVDFVTLLFKISLDFDCHAALDRALAIPTPDENRSIQAIYANITDED
jgi:hypothetical protein